MATQAFEIVRGTTEIAASATEVTITEGVDYTMPAGATNTNSFTRITNSRHTGMGNNAAGGQDQFTDDVSVRIDNPNNLLTNITFKRIGATNSTHISYEIICYLGAAGTGNSMIVRGTGDISAASSATITGTTITTIDDVNDCVVFITGQAGSDTGEADYHSMLYTASLVANGSDWDPTFTRGTSTAATGYVSYAVVEFTGANWTVDRISFTSTGTNWTPADNTSNTVAHGVTIADIAKAGIIEMQFSHDNDPLNVDDCGDGFYLDDATNIRYWHRSAATVRTRVAWILQNSQNDGSARNFKTQHVEYRDDVTSGSEPRTFTVDLTTDPASGSGATLTAPLDETSIVASVSSDGSGQPFPNGFIDYRLTGTNEITFKESDAGQERRIAVEIFEWPQDSAGAIVIEIPSGPWR